MGKRWLVQPHDAARVQFLQQTAGLPPVVAQLLVGRGIFDPQEATQFLSAKLSDLREPEELPGVTQAVTLLHEAVQAGRPITIYGDYDADGMTGTAIMLSGLRLLHANVTFYVPDRMEEGYGLNGEALRRLQENGSELVVTVDCGIASLEEAHVAREIGLPLIITDHHELREQLPAAAAIVHPRLPGHDYPFGGLCGAGVAFKVMWALCQRVSQAKRVTDRLRHFLLSAMGLAAIGTVADVVPLLDENRVIVRHGLTTLKAQPSIGLQALLQVAKLSQKRQFGSDDIAFGLAPRLNAAGRLGQARLAIELLTTESPDRARELAEFIEELNESRIGIERSIQLAARKQIQDEFRENDPAFVLAGRGWHQGVVGIVAGRLADQFHRPVVVLAMDEVGVKPASGSGRCIPGLNLNDALGACQEFLLKFGGHAAAAGLTIEERQIEPFRQAFINHVRQLLTDADLKPQLYIDAEAALPQLTLRTVEHLELLSPFGQNHPHPTLCARGVTLGNQPKKIGKGERHLSVMLQQGNIKLRAIGFHQGEWAEALARLDGPFDIAYRPFINEFNGWRSVEVQLVDWHAAGKSSAVSA